MPPYSMPLSSTARSIDEERRLADVEAALDQVVDVGAGVGAHHAGRDPLLAGAPAGHDDAVGAGGQRDVVGLGHRGGVGQLRVDLDDADLGRRAASRPGRGRPGRRAARGGPGRAGSVREPRVGAGHPATVSASGSSPSRTHAPLRPGVCGDTLRCVLHLGRSPHASGRRLHAPRCVCRGPRHHPRHQEIAACPQARPAAGQPPLGLALVAAPLAPLATAAPASASTSGLVISEVYGGGGNSGAPYTNDFIELQNTTGAAAPAGRHERAVPLRHRYDVRGHRAAAAPSPPTARSWSPRPPAPPRRRRCPRPTRPARWRCPAPAASSTCPRRPPPVAGHGPDRRRPGRLRHGDRLRGHGAGTDAVATRPPRPAQRPAPTPTTTRPTSPPRPPTPENSSTGPTQPPGDPVAATIEEIQGTGRDQPVRRPVGHHQGRRHRGVPDRRLQRLLPPDPRHRRRPRPVHPRHVRRHLRVRRQRRDVPAVGDYVQVTGKVTEFAGLTELTPAAGGVDHADRPGHRPGPRHGRLPGRPTPSRESLEGMLLAPQGAYTVTDNYSTNQYAEIGLAHGTRPLPQPTDVAKPGTPAAAGRRGRQRRQERSSSTTAPSLNFLTTGQPDIPLPYLTADHPIRVGRAGDVHAPGRPRLPQQRLEAPAHASSSPPRTPTPCSRRVRRHPHRRARRRSAATSRSPRFNVLNYFTDHRRRLRRRRRHVQLLQRPRRQPGDGQHLQRQRTAAAPRDDDDLAAPAGQDRRRDQHPRRRRRLARGDRELRASVGADRRDDALVHAGRRAQRRTPAPARGRSCPRRAGRPSRRRRRGRHPHGVHLPSRPRSRRSAPRTILVGDPAFDNAREPLAQAFKPRRRHADATLPGDREPLQVQGLRRRRRHRPGQRQPGPRRAGRGAGRPSPTQLKQPPGTDTVFLTGDFNSYTQEDPMQVAVRRRATPTSASTRRPDEYTYHFDGAVGSLDHVLANGRGAGATSPARRLEHQLGRVGRLRVQPLQLQRDGLLRARTRTAPATTTRCSSGSTSRRRRPRPPPPRRCRRQPVVVRDTRADRHRQGRPVTAAPWTPGR